MMLMLVLEAMAHNTCDVDEFVVNRGTEQNSRSPKAALVTGDQGGNHSVRHLTTSTFNVSCKGWGLLNLNIRWQQVRCGGNVLWLK